ncbi:MAG: tyrosine-type recombinase/integrase [Verrucomicrobiota bacterium]
MNRLAAVLAKDTLTDALTAGQLEQVVLSFNLSAKTCNEYRIMLANFFKWAAKQNPPLVPTGYNPAQAMDRQRIVQGEVEFVRVGELKKIIAALPDSRPDLLPLVVLVCFSGLRPSEATRLDWSEVGTDFIRLPGTKSKTGRSRQIPICENLKKWLEQWRKPAGLVCEEFSLVHVNPAIFRASGVRIAHDALRHGYATHRQKIINNLALLAEEMGNSVSVCRRHYANPFVLPDEAADWFSIAPSQV